MCAKPTIRLRLRSLSRWAPGWKTSLPRRLSTSGRSLLLNGLLIGIAPRADLQPTAHPAKTFGGIRRTHGSAHRALVDALELVALNGALGVLQQLLVDDGLGDRRQLPFHFCHYTNTEQLRYAA